MTAGKPKKKAVDLPTKYVRAADGRIVQMKVVDADSGSFAADFLAAFNANVKRVRSSRRAAGHADDAEKA